ncbi:MAG: hypothetical protein ACO25K_06600, partial [Candidatus Fonsibacter ubiquis]
MAGTTKENEDLACVALGYLSLYPNATYEDFYNFIQSPGQDWNKVKNLCDLEVTTSGAFQKRFSKQKVWMEGSYYTALAIRENLGIKLSEYYFCGVGSNTKGVRKHGANGNIGEILKTKAASAISKLYKFKTGENTGPIAKLNADKLNISDIFLIKKKASHIENFVNVINKADDIKTGTAGIKQILKEMVNPQDIAKIKGRIVSKANLTVDRYVRIMNGLYENKEVIGVSLKKLDPVPKNVGAVPFSIKGSSKGFQQEKSDDEFLDVVSVLIKLAKNGDTKFSEFEQAINEFVTLDDDIKFTSNDRLDVYFYLKYKGTKKKYKIFTNFVEGGNFHFVEVGGKGHAGEGGITIERFRDLSHEFPQLKTFFTNLSKKREFYFDRACKSNGMHGFSEAYRKYKIPNNLKLSSENETIYRSTNYEKFINLILDVKTTTKGTGSTLTSVGARLGPGSKPGTTKVLTGSITKKSGSKLSKDEKRFRTVQTEEIDTTNLQIIEQFFEEYTSFLGRNGSGMGSFAGLKSNTLNKIDAAINKAETSDDISKLIKSMQVSMKKSYALISNAEFGYIFANYNKQIKQILKKKVLLSLYSVASGRGFIIFKGKKFKSGDIYGGLKSPI